jgi:acylphosphatase
VSPLSRAHLHIHGRVQGVSYRYYAREQARKLGLAGWIRNCRDGSVEAVIEGAEDAVQRFIAWAHQGPSLAYVERIDVQREDADGVMTNFRIGYP